jgi:hypothetical protein
MKTSNKVMIGTAMAAAVLLSGCAAPDQATLAAADYGTYPADYRTDVSRYLDDTLKDPASAQVEYLADPHQGFIRKNIGAQPIYGYRVCFTLNAKNSYGGYTGKHLTTVLLRDGTVVDYKQADHTSDFMDQFVTKLCNPKN